MTTDELAGLPEDVREAMHIMDAGNTVNGAWNACRDELLRLARENAELTRALTERLDICGAAVQRAERAEAELAAIKATPTGTVLDWALRRAESAEAELEALKRRIAEAPTAVLADGRECVALLPVGG